MSSKTYQVNHVGHPLPEKRMALYARVASVTQGEKDVTQCNAQISELKQACLSNGWLVRCVVTDQGYSAGSLDRPGLCQLQKLVEGDEIDGILCTHPNRLSRGHHFLKLATEFKERNVEIISLYQAPNWTQPSSSLHL